jgi:N4-gp56 family major capsid protein
MNIYTFNFDIQKFAQPSGSPYTGSAAGLNVTNDPIHDSSNHAYAPSGSTNQVTINGDNLSAEMKVFYDMRLLDEAGPLLVHDQFGQKRPIPKNGGKTIEFRKFSNLPKALTPIVEGVTPAPGKIEVTSMTATVEQYGYYVPLSDMLELTAIDNVILETTKRLGQQSGLTLDTITRNVLNAGLNVMYCPKFVSNTETAVTTRSELNTTAQLTVDVVYQVAAKMKANNVPKINGSYVAIIHPYVAYDLMRDPQWQRPHEYVDPENIYSGELGRIGGVRFVEASEAKVWKDTTCPLINSSGSTTDAANRLAVFSTLFMGEGAYGVTEITGGGLQTIIKQKGSAGTADPLDQRSSVGWKAIKTAEILVPNYLVRVESCSARYSGDTAAN